MKDVKLAQLMEFVKNVKLVINWRTIDVFVHLSVTVYTVPAQLNAKFAVLNYILILQYLHKHA